MAFPKKARFVVIGAGIHGLSTAWHLAEKLKKKNGNGTNNDIVVIDKIHFVFMNSSAVVPIVNDYIYINTPFEKSEFLSPELKQLQSIPSKIYFTSCYYSLATLIFYALFKVNYTTESEELKKIYYSKLYFFLGRC